MTKTKQGKRLTIGFLTDYIATEYHTPIWHGVVDLAQERDVNLVCYVGSALGSTDILDAAANVAYDMVSADALDGLVILSPSVGVHKTPTEITTFCLHYHPLPVVSAGLALEGIPSVSVDNEEGLREVLSHLVEDHGSSHLAFIRGPEGHPEADLRYRVYADVLAAHGLPLDPNLVAPGTFLGKSGVAAIRLLIEERGLEPGVDFDAIAAANDDMARGAIEELQARGIRVPYDVAVAGFDDIRAAGFITPPLTTVRQPTYEMGRQAAELLLALLAGEDVPEQVALPTQLVVRQSCGCLERAVAEAAAGPIERAGKLLDAALAEHRDAILTRVARALEEDGAGLPVGWEAQLLDSLAASTKGESPHLFLNTLSEILRQAGVPGGDTSPPGKVVSSEQNLAAVQRAVSVLRREMLSVLDQETASRTEDFWNQAQVMVSEMARRVQAYQALRAEEQAQVLHAAGLALLATFDMEQLTERLVQELPQLGFPGVYLSLYEDPETPTEWARLTLAYEEEEGGHVELKPAGARFPSPYLAPPGSLPQRQYAMVLQILFFHEHLLGFALFETGPRDGVIYRALRGEISSALKGTLLLKAREETEAALEQAYAEVEKQIQERTAELRREIAEREFAQEESMHLQQEVIDAQKRAIQELSTPIIPVLERVIVMPLIGSVDTLRARDVTRRLLAGIRTHRARVVILDITGVPIVDSGVASHLNKTIQAARLKGARTIVTGISDAVAETIADLGIDWSGIDTLADLQTGLRAAIAILRQGEFGQG